jgi:RNA polymerase sigma-70 factor (ECF subfamily)
MSTSNKSTSRSASPGYSRLNQLPDEGLMEHLQAGHADALAVLFDRYHRLVLSVALRILRDAGEAEDVMQSVFLEIFRSAAQFDASKGSTKVWILQYAYHRSLNRRHYLNLRGFYERTEDSPPTQRAFAATDNRSLGMLESACLVREALARLNKTQKRTLELAFFEGLTMHEIAEKTGESFANVRHHYYRGLEKLRKFLCAPSTNQKEQNPPQQEVAHVKT